MPASPRDLVPGVYVGAPLEEHARGLGVAIFCSAYQGRPSDLRDERWEVMGRGGGGGGLKKLNLLSRGEIRKKKRGPRNGDAKDTNTNLETRQLRDRCA